MMKTVRSGGAATPLPPLAEPLTSMRLMLAGPTSSLSTAVSVTVPVLVVAPAAMVSVVPVCVKSPATAGATGDIDTVTVTSSLDAVLNVARTAVEAPSISRLDPGSSDRVGESSSSVIVTVATALLSVTWSEGCGSLNVNVNVRSGPSTASSTTVTGMFAVAVPDGIVSVPAAAV